MHARRHAVFAGLLVVAAGLLVVAAGLVGGSVADAAPGVQPAQLGEPCPVPADPVVPATVADVEALLVGSWVFCDGSIFPPTSASEVGVELTADGRLFRLADDGAGGVLRVEGLEQEGTWSVLGVDEGKYQLNAYLIGLGTQHVPLDLYGQPALTLVHSVLIVGEVSMVPWTGAPPVPGVPADLDLGLCGHLRDPLFPSSADVVEQLLIGTWLFCNGTPLVPPAYGEVGLFFDGEGRFFRLYRDDAGTLIRASGPNQQGTVFVHGHFEGNPPGTYQADLQLDGGPGVIGTFPLFLQDPPALRLGAGEDGDYLNSTEQPVPGNPPTAPPQQPVSPEDVELPATGGDVALVVLSLGFLVVGFVGLGVGRRDA